MLQLGKVNDKVCSYIQALLSMPEDNIKNNDIDIKFQ